MVASFGVPASWFKLSNVGEPAGVYNKLLYLYTFRLKISVSMAFLFFFFLLSNRLVRFLTFNCVFSNFQLEFPNFRMGVSHFSVWSFKSLVVVPNLLLEFV